MYFYLEISLERIKKEQKQTKKNKTTSFKTFQSTAAIFFSSYVTVLDIIFVPK